jgi:quinolinate synthase
MSTNTASRIHDLKKQLNAVVLVHYYQPEEIQDLGDFVGDSLGLCIEASKTDADTLVFCGVHFMAESAKLLNPEKLVLLPALDAGCPMANMAEAEDLKRMKEDHPDAVVVTYVNSTAAVKAESDICCTSSNAVRVINTIPEDREIIFVPDQNLGKYVMEQTGRSLILWPGYCPVHHERVRADDIRMKKQEHPEALVLVHPECTPEITAIADFVGSTSQILSYAAESDKREFIIGTEKGILYPLRERNPNKEFYLASDRMTCYNMKKIDLDILAKAMEEKIFPIDIDPAVAERAVRPIAKMVELG